MSFAFRKAMFVASVACGAAMVACSALTSFDDLVAPASPDASTSDASTSDATTGQVDGSAASDAAFDAATFADASVTPTNIKTVFVIPLTSADWPGLEGYPSAPYLNSLLTTSAYATSYQSVLSSLQATLPCMIWLEAADNLGVTDDSNPASAHQSTTSHLTTQLENAGVTWKTYEEGVSGTSCPLLDNGDYLVRHDPFVYFNDVTNDLSASSSNCISHVRPYTELATDLAAGTQPQYVFIVPNRCHDMHDDCPAEEADAGNGDPVKQGDLWLSTEVPKILASNAMKTGALFLVWDHPNVATASRLPFIVVSPFAKSGYGGAVSYNHSSFVRSIETIFGVPPIRAATTANDFSDLFTAFP